MNTNTTRRLVTVPTVVITYKVASANPPRIQGKAHRKMVQAAIRNEVFRAENRFYYGSG